MDPTTSAPVDPNADPNADDQPYFGDPGIIDHYDGFGLNDRAKILCDARAEVDKASHHYIVLLDNAEGTQETVAAQLRYQQGAPGAAGSIDGVTDQAVLAIVLDRYRGFQSGPFASRENAIVITKLEEALLWMKDRAFKRASRGVLGTMQA